MKYLVNEKKVRVSDYKGYYYRNNENSAAHRFDIKALTFIEADARISKNLVENNIIADDNHIVPASVQYFVYQTARQGNKELYDYIHEHYDVKPMMKKMEKKKVCIKIVKDKFWLQKNNKFSIFYFFIKFIIHFSLLKHILVI